MKKLLTLLVVLATVVAACASGTDQSVEELGSTVSDLATDAQALANDADLGAELKTSLNVVADDATTLGLSATGGEVSDDDLNALTGSLDGLEARIEDAKDSLDPAVQEQLESLTADLREVVDQLKS